MIILSIIICLLLCDSMYCRFMKKRSVKRISATVVVSETDNVARSKQNIRQRAVSFIMNGVDSFTFLLFKIVGYIPIHCIRNFFYRYVFWMTIGKRVVIYYGLEARAPWNIKIGNGSIVGDKVILDARHKIEIGENVNISTGAWMWTLQHDVNSPSFTSEGTGEKIVIGNRAWISSRTTLLPGSDVAEGVVVAAGAVVTKKIEDPFTIWGGIPAKKISERSSELIYEFNGQHRWFV